MISGLNTKMRNVRSLSRDDGKSANERFYLKAQSCYGIIGIMRDFVS
jgi:hypothetical protein